MESGTQVEWSREKGSPSKPPHDDEEPEHDGEEDDVPKPPAALSFCHVVHSAERPLEDPRRLRERIVLFNI